MTTEDMLALATRFEFPVGEWRESVAVELRDNGKHPGSSGEVRWAITRSGRQCLSRKGKWGYESMPSSRTKAWLTNNRYTDLAEALTIAKAAADKMRAEYDKAWREHVPETKGDEG